MSKLTTELLGVSAASVIRGLRHGPKEFRRASRDTTVFVNPKESVALGRIPIHSLEDFLAGRSAPITLNMRAYEEGALPWHELVALLTLTVLADPIAVLEIGTFMGFTTHALARNLPRAVVHTLDLPLDFQAGAEPSAPVPKDDFHLITRRQPGREFLHTPEAAHIRQHFGDSATWDFSHADEATCFFIDGSHTYEYCKLDSEKCFELCRGKGVFLWHDCNDEHPGVVRFLGEWRKLGRDIVRLRGTSLAYWDSR